MNDSDAENSPDPQGSGTPQFVPAAANTPVAAVNSSPDAGFASGQATSAYCPSCGKPVVDSAVICPGCGTPLASSRNKTVAVLLAVFLSFWTWLYTYQRDKQKFWMGLGLAILGVITSFFIIGDFILFGVWVWAIVSTAARPERDYLMYPKTV